MRRQGRRTVFGAVAAVAIAAVGVLLASPTVGAGPGYDQVYTAHRHVSISPPADLVLLRSVDSGGPNLSVTLSVVGSVALRAGYSYLVGFNRSSPNATCSGGAPTCAAHVTCGASFAGAPTCALSDRSGVAPVPGGLANASMTLVLSLAKAVLPTAAGFCLWARATGPGAPGDSLGRGVGAATTGSGGYANGSPLGPPLDLAPVSGVTVVAVLVAIGVARQRRPRRPGPLSPLSALPPESPPVAPLP